MGKYDTGSKKVVNIYSQAWAERVLQQRRVGRRDRKTNSEVENANYTRIANYSGITDRVV